MTRYMKQVLSCAVLLIVGLGLIIGGVFFPILLIPGVPIFVGGLGVLAAIVEDKDKIAFHTTINNINNYGPNIGRTISTERMKSRFNFGPSVREKIEIWNEKMRDLFAAAPKELELSGNNAPVLTFSHNYHQANENFPKASKLLIEDITLGAPKHEHFVPQLPTIDERKSTMPELEELDIRYIEATYKAPQEMAVDRM